jgi:hypothetical protein
VPAAILNAAIKSQRRVAQPTVQLQSAGALLMSQELPVLSLSSKSVATIIVGAFVFK